MVLGDSPSGALVMRVDDVRIESGGTEDSDATVAVRWAENLDRVASLRPRRAWYRRRAM